MESPLSTTAQPVPASNRSSGGTDAPRGQHRHLNTPAGAADVRVDPASQGIPAPRSRADQLRSFVAQFQADMANTVDSETAAQVPATGVHQPAHPHIVPAPAPATPTPAPAPLARPQAATSSDGLTRDDREKIDATLSRLDIARRQFSHAAGMSATPVDDIRSTAPDQTTESAGQQRVAQTPLEISTLISETIATQIKSASPQQFTHEAAPAAPRQPNFSSDATRRPEVTFVREATEAEARFSPLRPDQLPDSPLQPTPAPSHTPAPLRNLVKTPVSPTAPAETSQPPKTSLTNHATREVQPTEAMTTALREQIARQHEIIEADEVFRALQAPVELPSADQPTVDQPVLNDVTFDRAHADLAAPHATPVSAHAETSSASPQVPAVERDEAFETAYAEAKRKAQAEAEAAALAESELQMQAQLQAVLQTQTTPNVLADAATAACSAIDVNTRKVVEAISVDLAAWDVEEFHWPEVTDHILQKATAQMDQLTHYCLDSLAAGEQRVVVTGLRRRQGTSTIASVVARWAVANARSVLLVDADFADPKLSRSIGLSQEVSWLNVIRESLPTSESIIRSRSSGVCVMPLAAAALDQQSPGHLLDQLASILDEVKHGFDMVLVDAGPIGQIANELTSASKLLDAMLIVDEDPSSVAFREIKEALVKFGVKKFIAAQNSARPAAA